ncbi:MAG: DUF3048 domain-containing protein [Actinomyces sp.]|nr:MAG: DUF3048 domain-containing protein [Actinomyces sp.]
MQSLRRGLRAASVVFVAAVVASACGGGGDPADPDAAPTSTTTATATSTSTVSPTTSVAAGPPAPLTGVPTEPGDLLDAPALVVKIDDNDDRARPQAGLASADLVYEELIEGQKTRLAAVFHTTVPDRIGPVRSGRTSDIELLGDLGTPVFAYSGANPVVMGQFARAERAGAFVDVNALDVPGAYTRDERRRAPDNLYLYPDRLGDAAADAGRPVPLFVHDTGRADTDPGPGGGLEVAYPASFGRVSTHLWDPELGGWVRVQDGTLHLSEEGPGADLTEIAPANVVVAVIAYGRSDADPASPQAETLGEGPAWIATRGRIVEGRWQRRADVPGWQFTDTAGDEVALAPGPTWVLLANGDTGPFPAATVTRIDPDAAAERLAAARTAEAER